MFETCWALAYPLDILSEDEESAGWAPLPSAPANGSCSCSSPPASRPGHGPPARGKPHHAAATHARPQDSARCNHSVPARLQAALRGWITDSASEPDLKEELDPIG